MMHLKFHHIGYACRNLDDETGKLAQLGYVREAEDFYEPGLKVRGRFLCGPGPRLELLVQCDNSIVLEPWLSEGIKIYHLAYEVRDLRGEIDRLCANGAKMVTQPMPAVVFNERKVCFLMLPTMLLVELIAENQTDNDIKGALDDTIL
jgi:methylmalonyl-CoA/ethylmalonyl-CoA epimerase